MTATAGALAAQFALSARLRTVAPVLLGVDSVPQPIADPAADAAQVFEDLVSVIEADPADDRIWLLLVALTAVYPTRGQLDTVRRRFELDSAINLRMYLLDNALEQVQQLGSATTRIELIDGGVIVDVDHSAKHDLHTGIQRVSRNLLPLWEREHQLVPAAWSTAVSALRRLTDDESDRVIRWTAGPLSTGFARPAVPGGVVELQFDEAAAAVSAVQVPPSVLVPWRSVVVMVEVPPPAANDRLAAIGAASGNELVGIAYDAIPIVSADSVPPVESMKFARYLTAVKFASRMAGISAAATAELGGFVRMLPTQGLTGPVVSEVSLPATGLTARLEVNRLQRDGEPMAAPMVLSVGSHEPRKNHLAILHAAEVLWREGLRFTLQFIGGSGWGEDFPRRAADLKAAGRPVEVRRKVTDAELDQALSSALFTVFPSLHEGYGLPVAESLAHGTPVITSNFGSMAEIAAGGGALTIDPRDDQALIDAMRSMLCDPAQVSRLRAEIAGRPQRGWPEYAHELWSTLVGPGLEPGSAATRARLATAEGH